MIDFNYIKNNDLLLCRFQRGSTIYGTNIETSDIDHGGVYMEPLDVVLGTGIGWPETIQDEKQDEQWYTLRKYFIMLSKSNPNIFDSIFCDPVHYDYKHPAFDIILKERDKLVTKDCFNSFLNYGKTQLEKAYKLKSRIVNPVHIKLSPLDFVYYPYKQGSRKIQDWLDEMHLMQEHCGLTKVPHMNNTYNVFYDWGAHWLDRGFKNWEDFWSYLDKVDPEQINPDMKEFLKLGNSYTIYSKGDFSLTEFNQDGIKKLYEKYKTPAKYHGIISRGGDSEQIRYSSIIKDEKPLTQISYNKDEYSRHCQQYREWSIWKKHHNKTRFEEASRSEFDKKNAMHAARLMSMGIEIARGEGVKVNRANIDREFLLSIRRGEWSFEELMEYLHGREEEMKDAMEHSTLPEHVDMEFLNDIMIKVRKEFYGI